MSDKIRSLRRGLWANIAAKRERIEEGSGERMRRPGDPGAPTDKAIKSSQRPERGDFEVKGKRR